MGMLFTRSGFRIRIDLMRIQTPKETKMWAGGLLPYSLKYGTGTGIGTVTIINKRWVWDGKKHFIFIFPC